ncbi:MULTISPECIES: hypothetical protein [Bacillus]|uniref:Uncharacterized protein n=2 Tax=Bacillus thuringiensis TaxID=1428 RepID=A0A9W3KIW1_BACTU|nr:hypothetical protein [Bacillus thuringiensis]EKS8367103.1 hypothetical protein [Bacillus cereus]AHA75413.1 hypothetical protein YBT1518_33631 [Bacillus thuringiensis YBT-1518]EKS8372994.1 hypothetical protein [Bacillus cereus]MBG9483237.1 hypothetical protein [Bacillus thuringiensis]MBG9497224.1 hypothetical protein [Bacillus thuringiensis]
MATGFENITAMDLTSDIHLDKRTFKTNMKFSKKNKKSKFLMHGPKFFDELRIYLIKNNELGEYALPSSALATYILLHYKVNDLGRLPRDFKLSTVANESDIPYTTIHTGFQALLHSGLVREIFINGKIPVYEICNYARLNRTAKETKDNDGKLSYFRIPNLLLESSILKELVSHRDSKGIIELLNLCNNFTRELKFKSKDSIEKYTLPRNMDGLKERLGRNAKKVRNYLKIISPIFKFDAAIQKVRNPRKGRIARIREKIQQIVITQFTVSMNPACVIENDLAEIKQTEAKMRKEATARLESIGIALTTKDRKDIVVSYKGEVSRIATYIKNKQLRDDFMTYTMSYAMDQCESFLVLGEKIKSLGGMVRAKLRESFIPWAERYLDDDTRHALVLELISHDIDVPDAFRLT